MYKTSRSAFSSYFTGAGGYFLEHEFEGVDLGTAL